MLLVNSVEWRWIIIRDTSGTLVLEELSSYKSSRMLSLGSFLPVPHSHPKLDATFSNPFDEINTIQGATQAS